MSKIKNVAAIGSGICIKCSHSIDGDIPPPIVPQEKRVINEIVDEDTAYFILQAIQCPSGNRVLSQIHKKSAGTQHEVVTTQNGFAWHINVVKRVKKLKVKKENDDETRQAHVNIEIGP